MKEISSIFDVLKSTHNNVRVVEVESSHQLSDDQIESLKDLFKNITDNINVFNLCLM